MKKEKIIQIFVVVFMLAGLLGSGYLFYLKTELDKQITDLVQDLEDSARRQKMLQKKYAKEKAKVTTCMRAKLAQEAKNALLHKKVKTLAQENLQLAETATAMEKKFEAGRKKYEKKISALEEYKERMKIARTELIGKYRDLAQTEREKTRLISELKNEKQMLASDLKLTKGTLGRAKKHNIRLCEISEELTQKYKAANGVNAEPLTKIGMVELEHLIQTYIKRIDKEKNLE